MSEDALYELAAQTLELLGDHTVAIAESLTGGLISGALTAVPGASKSFRGSVVSYATNVKVSVLGVDPQLVATGGAVQDQVAFQMALGVARLLGSEFGLAVTGVAGPTPQDGQAPGTVFLAVVARSADGDVVTSKVESLAIDLSGVAVEAQRAYIRTHTIESGLKLLQSVLRGLGSE